MKTILLLSLIVSAVVGAVEPLEPRTLSNTPSQTLSISLHSEVTTMLVFPEGISMIVGAGLTDGTTPGLVQFDHRKGTSLVTFRPLQLTETVFAQIISGESVYFCRLKPEGRPDSVVTIAALNGNQEAVAAVPVEDVFAQRLAIPKERLRQLIELTRSSSVLGKAMPYEYQGSQEVDVSMANFSGGYETRIETIRRFPKEDALVFLGTVTNRGSMPLPLGRLFITAGESRKLTPNLAISSKVKLGVGESANFTCVLAGDGQRKRVHLSLKNKFSVQFVPTSTPSISAP